MAKRPTLFWQTVGDQGETQMTRKTSRDLAATLKTHEDPLRPVKTCKDPWTCSFLKKPFCKLWLTQLRRGHLNAWPPISYWSSPKNSRRLIHVIREQNDVQLLPFALLIYTRAHNFTSSIFLRGHSVMFLWWSFRIISWGQSLLGILPNPGL